MIYQGHGWSMMQSEGWLTASSSPPAITSSPCSPHCRLHHTQYHTTAVTSMTRTSLSSPYHHLHLSDLYITLPTIPLFPSTSSPHHQHIITYPVVVLGPDDDLRGAEEGGEVRVEVVFVFPWPRSRRRPQLHGVGGQLEGGEGESLLISCYLAVVVAVVVIVIIAINRGSFLSFSDRIQTHKQKQQRQTHQLTMT